LPKTTLATTPSPKMISIIVPKNSDRKICIFGLMRGVARGDV
jgi:hypothetical protein